MAWLVAGTSPSVQAAAAALLASASSAFALLVAGSGIDPGLADLQAALTITGTGKAAAVSAFCKNYALAVIASWSAFDDSLSSRGPMPVADPSYGLATLAQWNAGLPTIAQDGSPDAVQKASNQNALLALVQGAALSAYVRIATRASYASQNDAEAARDALTGLIDTQASNAANAGNGPAFARWQALYKSVSADLTTRGKKVPNVVFYRFQDNRTALALAQMFYQDGSRAGELVARNAAPFPLFMPTSVEALAS